MLIFALAVPRPLAASDELCEKMMASCDEAISKLKIEVTENERALETCKEQRTQAVDRPCVQQGSPFYEKMILFLAGLFAGRLITMAVSK